MKKNTKVQILEVLPTKIFSFECPDEKLVSETLISLKKEEWDLGPEAKFAQTICRRLDKEKDYAKLYLWFDSCLEAVRNFLNLQCDELKITLSWANKSSNHDSLQDHKHPNSYASGVFYLTDSDVKTVFNKYNTWSNFDGISFTNFQLNSGSGLGYAHQPKRGHLLIFPSSLSHFVKGNNEQKERYTISFNSFPSGKIGDFGNLSGLNIIIK